MAPPLVSWKVLERKNFTPDVFELKVSRPAGFQFRAGQYISIVIPGAGPGGRNLRRAYSIASPPEFETIELCIKLVEGGPGTTYLNSLKVGDEFQGQAPFGDFCLEHEMSKPALFIGTGTGLAPLRSMVLSQEWKPQTPFGFLLGVRDSKDIIYPEFFSRDSKPLGFESLKHVQIALSRPSEPWPNSTLEGFKGRVTDYLRNMSDWDFKETHYYLCGSGDMIAEVKEILANKGVDKDKIHMEKYF